MTSNSNTKTEDNSNESGFNIYDYDTSNDNEAAWHKNNEGSSKNYYRQGGNYKKITDPKFSPYNRQSQGIMKITPLKRQHKYAYTTVTYVAENSNEPEVQYVPISDISVIPHQISYSFFDTSEGKIGISNPTEEHMIVEADIYVTDLVMYYWRFNTDANSKRSSNGVQRTLKNYGGVDWMKKYRPYTTAKQMIKATEEFVEDTAVFWNFRQNFLQQHSGWVCQFSSHAFGTFAGVLTEVKYDIESGFMDAKFHIKIEEAIFTADYGTKDDQEETDTETSADIGVDSTDQSGDAVTDEVHDIGLFPGGESPQ